MGDTAGQEDFDRIRYLSYRGTDMFLLCFSVMEPVSFANIKSKWIPEVKYHTKKQNCKPLFVLIGLKSDLRNDDSAINKLKGRGAKPVQQAEIDKMMTGHPEVKAYVECSALTRLNVDECFQVALDAFFAGDIDKEGADAKKPSGCCTLL